MIRVGGIGRAEVVEPGADLGGHELGGFGADGRDVGGIETFRTEGDNALDERQQHIAVAEVRPSVIGGGRHEPHCAPVHDVAGEKRLAVFPAGEGGGATGGHLAADGFEAFGRDRGAVEAVAEWAVGAVPFLDDEILVFLRRSDRPPIQVEERRGRSGGGWKKRNLATGRDEPGKQFGSGTGGQRSRPEDGGNVGGLERGGLTGVDDFRLLFAEIRWRGGEGEIGGGFAGSGDDDRPHGAGRAVGEEGDVIAVVAIGGDGKPAEAAVAAGREGDAFLEPQGLAGQREGVGRAGAVEVGGEGNGGGALGLGGVEEFQVEQQVIAGAAGTEQAERGVGGGGAGDRQHAEGGLLRQAVEGGAGGGPALVIGLPVGGLQIGGEPDFGPARGFAKKLGGAGEQGGEIRGGVRGGSAGKLGEHLGRRDILGRAGRAINQDEPGVAERFHRLADFFQNELAARGQAIAGAGFHGGGAVEDEHDQIDRTATPTEQPGNDRAGGGERQRGDAEGAAGENEKMPELLLAARFTGRLEQKLHGRPVNRLVAAAIQQVDDHRNTGGQQAPEHELVEKSHSKKALSTKHQALNGRGRDRSMKGKMRAALLLGVAFDGGKDAGEFIGFAVEGAKSGLGGFVRRGGTEQTEPDLALVGFLF